MKNMRWKTNNMDRGVAGAAVILSPGGGHRGRWEEPRQEGEGEGGDGGLSADKKESKTEKSEGDVTATILVAMEIRSASPTGGAVNTKGGKRPRAIQRVFFHCIRRRGEARWSSFTWRRDEGKHKKNFTSLSGFTISFSSPATFHPNKVLLLFIGFAS